MEFNDKHIKNLPFNQDIDHIKIIIIKKELVSFNYFKIET